MTDLDLLADATEAGLPELKGKVRPLTVLGEGWNSLAVETVGGVVFRIPKHAEAARKIDIERRVMPELAPILPVAVPVPAWRGRPSSLCPYGLTGYRKVPGEPVDVSMFDHVAVARFVKQLGEFFAALHAFPLERASELGVPDNWREQYLLLRGAVMPLLAKELTPDEYAQVDAWWENYLSDGRNWNFLPVVVHGDVRPEHLLVNKRGDLTGVIDFGEVMIGDAALDFGGIAGYVSPEIAHITFESYRANGGALDQDSMRRATTLAMAVPFFTISMASRTATPQVPTLADGIAELRAGPILSD
jgi:aminoglycoside phosphotransferase (APT) family kinase protein